MEGKTYKIHQNNAFNKAFLVEQNDSVLNFKIKNKVTSISKNEISEIKVRKFSILK